jgi:hypothetical protein
LTRLPIACGIHTWYSNQVHAPSLYCTSTSVPPCTEYTSTPSMSFSILLYTLTHMHLYVVCSAQLCGVHRHTPSNVCTVDGPNRRTRSWQSAVSAHDYLTCSHKIPGLAASQVLITPNTLSLVQLLYSSFNRSNLSRGRTITTVCLTLTWYKVRCFNS